MFNIILFDLCLFVFILLNNGIWILGFIKNWYRNINDWRIKYVCFVEFDVSFYMMIGVFYIMINRKNKVL